ncbi:MAG: hypothetical protein WCV58_01060 [Patescibacteria group bacterium]
MNIAFFNQIDFGKLIQKNYLFEATPTSDGLYKYLAIIFVVFILVGFTLIIKAKNIDKIYKNLYTKVINLSLFTGFLGLFLLFFRYEEISYIGSRFIFFVSMAAMVIWAITIIWYRFMILPKKIKEYEKKKNFEKYLP